MNKLNPNQSLAVKNIEGNYLINAGAGTGKTMVLVERYLEILERGNLEEGKEIESIVAITFTKKAAQEMIERIREKLREKYDEGDRWKRIYRDIEKSNISTIHSFCSSILREKPIEAKLDPMFEILEDVEAEKLLKNTIMEILSEEIEDNEDLYQLYVNLNITTVSGLLDDLYYLYNDIRNLGEDLKILKEIYLRDIKKLEIDPGQIDRIRELVEYLMGKLRSNARINNLLKEDLWIKFAAGDYNSEDLKDSLILIEDNMGTSKPEAETMDELKELINRALKSFELENIHFYSLIMDLLIKIDGVYESKKRKLSVLDYDDLQLKLLKLLDNPRIIEEYQDRYRYIMIDEFQDTNEVQKEIFYKLSSKNEILDRNNLFLVGDPKQSIYGFRGADLQVFYDVLDDIGRINKENIITLDDNYRTSSNVMEFINNIFSKLMGEKYTALKTNIESSRDISIEILEEENLEVPADIGDSDYSRHYEADLIAKRIKGLVEAEDYKYGDFALLFRSTPRDYIYENALKDYNIPFYNTGGRGYFKRQEVLDITNALKAILNPKDEISNIGFLRSPMVGLSDIEIYKILRREGSVYEKLVSLMEDENREDLKDLLEVYDHLYEFKRFNGLSDLVEEILRVTRYKELILLKNESRQSIANLNKFLDLIREFEDMKKDESMDILEYLEEVGGRDEFQSKVELEQEDVVKLLTIHKSKGLEFPVVIIPEMSSGSFPDTSNINFHKDLGIGLKLKDNTAIYNEIKDARSLGEEEEDERILYVAMTRTEDLLILGMQGKNRGLKKMISKIIGEDGVRKIAGLDLDKDRKEDVKLLADDLLLESEDIKIPKNIYEDEDFDKAKIEKFSISQFLTFKFCRREYFFKHYKKLSNMNLLGIDGEEELPIDVEIQFEEDNIGHMDPLTRGNIVHDFCELYNSNMAEEELLTRISRKYGVEYSDIREEVDPYIRNYLKEYDESYDEIHREKNFMIKIGGGIFTGAIDRINIRDDYVEIVDYKTNRLCNRKYLLDIYSPQLQFYTYVVENLLGKKVSKARLVFLENGESLEVDISREKIDGVFKELIEFVEFVSNNHSMRDYTCEIDCDKKCQYDIICKQD